MDAARKGIITPEMKIVAEKEYRTEEEIRDLVAKGQVAICANRLHTCIDPNGVGSMLRTKINVNLGVSRDCKDYDIEMQKVNAAVDMGAEAIMDLSSHGNTQPSPKSSRNESSHAPRRFQQAIAELVTTDETGGSSKTKAIGAPGMPRCLPPPWRA